jgi:hypothetical protein
LQQKAKNHDNLVSPAAVNREMILLKSMLKKAAEWYGLSLRTITLDLAKEESRERILSRNEMGLFVANAQIPLKHVILVALNPHFSPGIVTKCQR